MREFLSGLFEVSLTMGAVTALLLILSPVWKRRFRPQWRCWAWLLVALRLAVLHNLHFYNELMQRIRDSLDKLASFLYEKETITGEEFMDMLRTGGKV